jgi:hypothetical protein
MSKRARALVFGVMLAAMNLAGMTAVAQAQPSDEPASNQDARRPPTQGQVGESYRNYHEALAGQAQTAQDDAVERFRRGERASRAQPTIADETRRPPTEAQVGESWRHPVNVPVQPAEPSSHPVSLVAWLGVLAVALALAGGLVVLAARRAGRKVPAGQAG